jgi:hypothetical protein
MHAWLVLKITSRGGRTLPAGSGPNEIHIPGIMVQRIFKEKSLKKNRAKNG